MMKKSSPRAGQVSTSKLVSEVKVHVGLQMVIRLATGSYTHVLEFLDNYFKVKKFDPFFFRKQHHQLATQDQTFSNSLESLTT